MLKCIAGNEGLSCAQVPYKNKKAILLRLLYCEALSMIFQSLWGFLGNQRRAFISTKTDYELVISK